MIKKYEWDKEKWLKIDENTVIIQFEDFYIRTEKENDKIKNVYILGNKVIDFTKFNVIELTYQKTYKDIYFETHNINKEIYDYESDILHLVSIMTLESLQNFKYTEKLNLLTFAFEKESIALLFLSYLENLRFKLWIQNYLKRNNNE